MKDNWRTDLRAMVGEKSKESDKTPYAQPAPLVAYPSKKESPKTSQGLLLLKDLEAYLSCVYEGFPFAQCAYGIRVPPKGLGGHVISSR